MPVFLLKSLLSVILFVLALFAMFTMFEVFGRNEKKYNIERLKKIHRANGIVYFLFFILTAYFCLNFILNTKAELSPRASFHAVFALSVVILLALKVAFVRFYKQFYNQVKIIGLLIGLITFALIGTSGGYYLLVTELGTDQRVMKALSSKKQENPAKNESKIEVRTDAASIAKGKELYESKCYFCHDAYSTKKEVGPGHKGILKNPLLPVSEKPATPENIANQLRNPYKDMPSFSYLSDEEVQDIIAFLNTL
ncbi:MAG: cytochrome c [Nitrospirae bacterium]|nr:cytochrome c [Nitrospirota bacterium]